MHSLPDFPVSIPWMIAWIIVLVIALAGFVQMLIALNRNGHRKIIGNVKPSRIVPCIAVRAADGTADHQIHVLNQILDASAHAFSFSSRFC